MFVEVTILIKDSEFLGGQNLLFLSSLYDIDSVFKLLEESDSI